MRSVVRRFFLERHLDLNLAMEQAEEASRDGVPEADGGAGETDRGARAAAAGGERRERRGRRGHYGR